MQVHSSQLLLANLITAEDQGTLLNCKPALSRYVQVHARHILPQPPSLVFLYLFLSEFNFRLFLSSPIIKINQYAEILIAALGFDDRKE